MEDRAKEQPPTQHPTTAGCLSGSRESIEKSTTETALGFSPQTLNLGVNAPLTLSKQMDIINLDQYVIFPSGKPYIYCVTFQRLC